MKRIIKRNNMEITQRVRQVKKKTIQKELTCEYISKKHHITKQERSKIKKKKTKQRKSK